MADFETGVNNILGGSIGPRIRASLEQYAQRKGMPLREYVKTLTGFMAALLALNKASGMQVYDVIEDEAYDESAIAARRRGPGFILDDQSEWSLMRMTHSPDASGLWHRGQVPWGRARAPWN
jgi:hypothetical protein